MDAEGNWVDMQKQPKTDPSKNSLKGRVTVVRTPEGGFVTHPVGDDRVSAMVSVYCDGGLLYTRSFDGVRRAARA